MNERKRGVIFLCLEAVVILRLLFAIYNHIIYVASSLKLDRFPGKSSLGSWRSKTLKPLYLLTGLVMGTYISSKGRVMAKEAYLSLYKDTAFIWILGPLFYNFHDAVELLIEKFPIFPKIVLGGISQCCPTITFRQWTQWNIMIIIYNCTRKWNRPGPLWSELNGNIYDNIATHTA